MRDKIRIDGIEFKVLTRKIILKGDIVYFTQLNEVYVCGTDPEKTSLALHEHYFGNYVILERV